MSPVCLRVPHQKAFVYPVSMEGSLIQHVDLQHFLDSLAKWVAQLGLTDLAF